MLVCPGSKEFKRFLAASGCVYRFAFEITEMIARRDRVALSFTCDIGPTRKHSRTRRPPARTFGLTGIESLPRSGKEMEPGQEMGYLGSQRKLRTCLKIFARPIILAVA
jgi:hypothetical protein